MSDEGPLVSTNLRSDLNLIFQLSWESYKIKDLNTEASDLLSGLKHLVPWGTFSPLDRVCLKYQLERWHHQKSKQDSDKTYLICGVMMFEANNKIIENLMRVINPKNDQVSTIMDDNNELLHMKRQKIDCAVDTAWGIGKK